MNSAIDLKFEYTENNHFKWGFGDEWHNSPSKLTQFKIHLGHITRPVMSFREECVHAAKLIAAKATKPICVGLSGGNDSQMVCLSLLEAKIPFKVLVTRLYDEFWDVVNQEDLDNAKAFIQKHNLEEIEYHLNLDYFYNDGAIEYATEYGFTNLHTITQCDMMDHVCEEYCYIMAGGDVVMTPVNPAVLPNSEVPLIPGLPSAQKVTVPLWWQSPQPILQHMMNKGYEGTSKFFLYTPELLCAYLEQPKVKMFRESQDIILQNLLRWKPNPKFGWWKFFHMLYKPLMVKEEFPDAIMARKLTGYEELTGFSEKAERTPTASYRKKLVVASKGKCEGQVVCPTIDELLDYIKTQHTEDDALLAVKTIYYGT
jgi:hypothetical protein